MKHFIFYLLCFFPSVLVAQTTFNAAKIEEDKKILTEKISPFVEKIQLLLEEYQNTPKEIANNEEYLAEIQSRFDTFQGEIEKIYIAFIHEHPNSYISLMAITELSQSKDMATIEALLKSLSPELQNTEEGKALLHQIRSVKLTAIGSVAPDFTQNDPSGKPVRLSDFRGKYLLIDFWASWCGPCRKENANVVKAYHLYKDKNFDILGISLDNPGNKQSWLNAIDKDRLPWTQVSDLNGWKNAVAVQYSVVSIPHNLLLDPNGVIIAKNLRGNELIAKLAELLGK